MLIRGGERNSDHPNTLFFTILKKVFIYFERESASGCISGGGAERERERERRIPSWLHTVSAEPDSGIELTNREIMT